MKTFTHNRTLQIHLRNVHSLSTDEVLEPGNKLIVAKRCQVVHEEQDINGEDECQQALEGVLHEDMILSSMRSRS